MRKFCVVALVLAAMPFGALAGDNGLFYVAGGATNGRGSYSIGAGTNVDVLEISSINLGTVDGNTSVRFRGVSLVQNAVPVKDFNLLFRLGVGKTTTTFANGASATKMGFSNGIILGVGGQYQVNSHLAFRGEVDRITYAASADGLSSHINYPVTLSVLYLF